VTELQNQDPTANTDPNEYVDQLVQVNSLQQLIQANQGLTNIDGGLGAIYQTLTGTGSASGSGSGSGSSSGSGSGSGSSSGSGSGSGSGSNSDVVTNSAASRGNLSANLAHHSANVTAAASKVATALGPGSSVQDEKPGSSFSQFLPSQLLPGLSLR